MHPARDGSFDNLIVVSATQNTDFAQKIATYLNIRLCKTERLDFRDSDLKVRIAEEESVRGKDVYLVTTIEPPFSQRLQELIVWIDALISGAAERVTLVLPFLFGSRQDRKTKRGEPINVRAYINALVGVAKEHGSKIGVMTADLHSEQLQTLAMYFDSLKALPLFAADIKEKHSDIAVIAPDAGGLKKAEELAKRLNASALAWIAKTRPKEGEAMTYGISGDDIQGKTAVIIDDMIDSGGTLVKACEAIRHAGAAETLVYVTHLLLTKPDNLASIPAKIIGTDTIYHPAAKLSYLDIHTLPLSSVFAEAIRRKHLGVSTRELYSENVADVIKYSQTSVEKL